MAKRHKGLIHWKEDTGKNLEGSELSSHCKVHQKQNIHVAYFKQGPHAPCSRNLKKNCWSIFFFFSKSPGPISASCTMEHPCCDTKTVPIFLRHSMLWCRHLKWPEAIEQIAPRLQCSVNKAYTHQNSAGFTAISKGNRVKLEDRGRSSGGHLYMWYLKRNAISEAARL